MGRIDKLLSSSRQRQLIRSFRRDSSSRALVTSSVIDALVTHKWLPSEAPPGVPEPRIHASHDATPHACYLRSDLQHQRAPSQYDVVDAHAGGEKSATVYKSPSQLLTQTHPPSSPSPACPSPVSGPSCQHTGPTQPVKRAIALLNASESLKRDTSRPNMV